MAARKAFTLIELLVVITIIALLMAILMPVLERAREQGMRIVCLNNLRQLVLAWNMYADENDGRIVRGDAEEYNSMHTNELAWVRKDWPRYTLSDAEMIKAIKAGAFFYYTKNIRLYKCPNAVYGEWRTYSAVDSMNADDFDGGPMLKHRTDFLNPTNRIVFIENSGATPMGGWSIYYKRPAWRDEPPVRHGDGGTLGFADGHSEYWKCLDPDTHEYNDTNTGIWKAINFPNSLDIPRMQLAVWGKLGY